MKPFGRSWWNGLSVATAVMIAGQAVGRGEHLLACLLVAAAAYWLRAEWKAR